MSHIYVQAAERPKKTAISMDRSGQSWTFEELENRSNQAAQAL